MFDPTNSNLVSTHYFRDESRAEGSQESNQPSLFTDKVKPPNSFKRQKVSHDKNRKCETTDVGSNGNLLKINDTHMYSSNQKTNKSAQSF